MHMTVSRIVFGTTQGQCLNTYPVIAGVTVYTVMPPIPRFATSVNVCPVPCLLPASRGYPTAITMHILADCLGCCIRSSTAHAAHTHVSCPLPASSVAQRQEIATHKISQLDWTYKMGLRPVFASGEKPSCWMDMMVAKKHHPFAISLVKVSRGLSCHAVMCYAMICSAGRRSLRGCRH